VKPAKQCLLSLVFSSLIVAGAMTARSELHTGIGFGAWDFSDSTATALNFDFTPADVDPALAGSASRLALGTFLIAGANAALAILPEVTTFESVTEAPADPAVYEGGIPFYWDRVWVSRTREGHYAKFRYLADVLDLFEYVYQDDGSRSFTTPVTTDVTTWGRVKALHR